MDNHFRRLLRIMPWTEKQVKLFRAIEHGWHPAGDKRLESLEALGHDKLKQMADEGVSKKPAKK